MLVTLAIPAYDEEECLEGVVREARAALDALGHADSEILVVDDGSKDRTAAIALRLAAELPNVRVHRHAENRGFTGAMTTCFRESSGDWVFLASADGQTDMRELGRFLAHAGHADLVVGVRASRSEGAFRVVLSRGFHLIARILFALPQREFSSVFLFRRALLEAMPFRSRARSAALLPEILFRARTRGARCIQLEVNAPARRGGRAKGGQLSVALLTLAELTRVALLARFDEVRGARRAF